MRSRTGCQTCRSRKLKCDEIKPICGQCRKGSRECQPNEGVIFRHQQNASMNGGAEHEGVEEEGKLGSFFAYKNTFTQNQVWVDMPKNVTFHNITNPYNMESTPEPEPVVNWRLPQGEEVPAEIHSRTSYEDASGLDTLSAAATRSLSYSRPLSVPVQTPDPLTVYSPPASNNLEFILNPTLSDSLEPSLSLPSIVQSPIIRAKAFPYETPAVEEHEVAFLLRHFGETTGQWMDLFDLNCFFAQQVPILALSSPLLKFSACAYAGKQLGRVRGRSAVVGCLSRTQGSMELYPQAETVDWGWIGAKYYDQAIALLMGKIVNLESHDHLATPVADIDLVSSPQSNNLSTAQSLTSPQPNKKRRLSRSLRISSADETLAAAAILCSYECLDNANSAWAAQLSGTKSMFDMVESESLLSFQSPTRHGAELQVTKPSRAQMATFWNFARQDFLAAFINEDQTRLNTADYGLWKAAGLELDNHGFILSNDTENSPNADEPPAMNQDMTSNALIWLLSKIVNYIASGDSIDHVFPQDPASPAASIGINQMVLLERWKELEHELASWHRALPITFKPCARLSPIKDGSVPVDSGRAIFSEIWYNIPMCAAAMQFYHMARIVLLVNKPHESTARRTTLTSRLYSYQAIAEEARFHSHEICGIALSRPEASVRIHQIQPLFVAGSCLTDDRERRVIIDILREIEFDLGWVTDYRVKELQKAWGWDEIPT